jgi:hypothetical protein
MKISVFIFSKKSLLKIYLSFSQKYFTKSYDNKNKNLRNVYKKVKIWNFEQGSTIIHLHLSLHMNNYLYFGKIVYELPKGRYQWKAIISIKKIAFQLRQTFVNLGSADCVYSTTCWLYLICHAAYDRFCIRSRHSKNIFSRVLGMKHYNNCRENKCNLILIQYEHSQIYFKGAVQRDFLPPIFFTDGLLLSHLRGF